VQNIYVCTYKVKVPIFDLGYGSFFLNITSLYLYNKSGASLKFSLYILVGPVHKECSEKHFLRLY
jgi:hypothetical protein